MITTRFDAPERAQLVAKAITERTMPPATALELIDAALAVRTALANDIESGIVTPESGQRIDLETEHANRNRREDAAMLRRGITGHDGVSDYRLEALRGCAGVNWLLLVRERIAALPPVVAPQGGRYRYTGPAGKAEVEGRVLVPGDEVTLTANQAESWADRFEAVAS